MQRSARRDPSGNGTAALFVPVTRRLPWNTPARLVLTPKTPMLLEEPSTPTLLEKPSTPAVVLDVPITPACVSELPNTPAVVGRLPVGVGPCVPEMPLTPLRAPEMLCTPGPKNDTARMAVLENDAPWMPSPSRENPMMPGCVLAAPRTPARKPAGTGGWASTWPY